MSIYRLKHVWLSVAVCIFLAGCSVPHVLGMGSYYQVTDPSSGKVYFTHQIEREDRGVVEFMDDTSDSWVSLPDGEVKTITEAEYRAGLER
ncbi:MAG: hypothetical protein KJ040_07195 [Gammaproteobacteria bacterium]|nr:hypothetical protein [Gammaproteobacteria bacterium]